MNHDDRKVLWHAILIALFVTLAASAFAADMPRIPVSCEIVRAQVAEHGRFKAIRWARVNGYTWAQIAQARKCLR